MDRLFAFVRRHGPGAWGLALLSACIFPVAVHVGTLHRAYWFPGAAPDFWPIFAAWTARLWGLAGVVALAGWAGGARVQTPGAGRWLRVGLGARIGLLGWLVWCAAAVPGVVWATRLGVVTLPGEAGTVAGVLLITAVVAGVAGRWRAIAGLFAGCAFGPALLWVAA